MNEPGFKYRVIYQSLIIGIISFLSFIYGLLSEGTDITRIALAQTMAYTVLGFSQLVHVFNIRDNKKSIFNKSTLNNKQLNFAIIFNTILMLLTLFVPQIRDIFKLTIIPKEKIPIMVILILLPIVIVELMKLFKLNEVKEEKDDLD